jgi:hypothetical protein
MFSDITNLLVLLVSVAAAFFVSRWFASRWRARHRDESARAAREAESRQVRRARERGRKG